jgi:branched-chain amino acid transport system permease protein
MAATKFFQEKWFYVLLLALALLLPFLVTNRYHFQVITMGCLFSIATLSLNLILGYSGQASLAHAGFFGIGAYGVAMLTKGGVSFWFALPFSALVSAFIGLLIGFPTLRTRGSYFAISTMCFGVIVSLVAANWVDFTGGANGITGIPVPDPIPVLFGAIHFQSLTAKYYLVLAFLLLTLWIMHRLVNSLQGLSFMAIRNNEVLAEAVGLNTFFGKLLSFVVANFFAGLAGGLYASLIGNVDPSTASLELTFSWLIYLLLGGAATLAGPIIGAFAIPVLMEYLQFLAEYRLIIFGALLIVVIIYFPRGMMGGITTLQQRAKDFYGKRKGAAKGAVAG